MCKWFLVLSLFSSQLLLGDAKVLLFSGSTREGSYNKKLIFEAAAITKTLGACPQVIDLKEYPMPFYDGDLETSSGLPEHAKRLRQLMIQSNVIVIASPEYNGSVSAVLKNTLDWASRAETGGPSRDAYKGKTFVLLSSSPGSGGGKRGLVQLRSIIEAIGGTVLAKQLSVANASKAFDDKGLLVDPKVRQELHDLLSEAITK